MRKILFYNDVLVTRSFVCCVEKIVYVLHGRSSDVRHCRLCVCVWGGGIMYVLQGCACHAQLSRLVEKLLYVLQGHSIDTKLCRQCVKILYVLQGRFSSHAYLCRLFGEI